MSPKQRAAAEAAASLQLQQFLDDWHHCIMQSSLGRYWSKNRATACALTVLAMNGASITQEEIAELVKLDEQTMIQEVTGKFTDLFRDNFYHLSIELQGLIGAATRVRTVVDKGTEQQIQDVLEELDTTSLGQQILKSAVQQASKEVAKIHRCQATWVRNMEKRLDRLTQAADLAEKTQKQLVAVEAQLERFGQQKSQKSKQALLGFALNNEKSWVQSVFASWLGLTIRCKAERDIRLRYEKEIEETQRKLFEYKKKQLETVRNVFFRKIKQGQEDLLSKIIFDWKREADACRKGRANSAEMEALESKIAQMSKEGADNAKRVMARMGAEKESTLVAMVFGAWCKSVEDTKKEEKMEEEVKKAEALVKEFLDKKKEAAKQVLDRLQGSTDSGLLSLAFSNWVQWISEGRKARELEMAMDASGDRFKSLRSRFKDNARSVQARMTEQTDQYLCLRILFAWQTETKVNRVDKYYTHKMESKRKQLQSVQMLFKRFAKELEEGLGNVEGDSSGRMPSSRPRKQVVPNMTRDGGSVSLPDIHAARQF